MFVDNILRPVPRFVSFVAIVQDSVFGQVLFHEIGHHVHLTQAPEFREREDVADAWGERLLKPYLRQNYLHLRPLVLVMWWAVRAVQSVNGIIHVPKETRGTTHL